ncbi:MAG: peptidylprolyl isomerase, partial [Candidatus Nanoarchaeia archaeon]|nr:peptidylprolyl isomerase [Candidatus Nanoarchaeia archaeon]
DTVSLHYTGTLEDGAVFDSSVGKQPLTFTAGAGQMISGFDSAVMGMGVGDKKTFTLSPSQAYGEVRQDLIHGMGKADLMNALGQEPAVGMVLSASNGMTGTITNISNEIVSIDFNHELAGKALTFTIEVVDIKKV